MAETKYGKYFFSGFRAPGGKPPPGGGGVNIARLDGAALKGCHFISIAVLPTMDKLPPTGPRTHAPHIHKYGELLIHLGMNPDDPFDLGAEVEMCMGKEMEKHTFTKSTVIWIPPNFIHAPWTIKRSWRRWIFIQINQGPLHTEKFYNQILPKEMLDQVIPGEDEWH